MRKAVIVLGLAVCIGCAAQKPAGSAAPASHPRSAPQPEPAKVEPSGAYLRELQGGFSADPVIREREIRAMGWPEAETEAVIARRVAIGMTGDMVRGAWGPPQSINVTTTASGRREQWVYGIGRYVYLTNGIVEAIQSSQ